MNEATLKTVAKVVAVILIFLGVLYSISSLAVFLGSSIIGVGSNMASGIGETLGDYPYVFAFLGGFIILAFGIFDVVLGFSLWRFQKWTPVGLYIFAAYNIISTIVVSIIGGFTAQSFTSILFGAFIAWIGYALSTSGKALLK
jgi:hypothetical protein